jgi:hypothetical protein
MDPFRGQRILDADLDNHPVGGLDKMGFILEAVRRIQIPLVLGFSGFPVNLLGRTSVVNPELIGLNSIFTFLLPIFG